jgi:hypothetical protein
MRRVVIVSSLLVSLGLAGCFFGMATVGGSLTGLSSGASVTLQNNGSNDLTLTQNGRFTFSRTLDSDDDYSVTVLTQPVSQTCTVTNGSGKINSRASDVENVQVSCTTTAGISGTVTGLTAGVAVTLLNNGGNALVVGVNGPFVFSNLPSNGAAYAVTVGTQPAGLTCTVANGSGNYTIGTATNVAVTCAP